MIGIFDSGVGGLTVAKEIFKHLPKYQTIYFGDTARLPYGTKGADFVKKYSAKITDWLLSKKSKIIVVACHTSSAWASDFLKKKYKNVPIFDMISFTAKDVASGTKNKKIGIIGTPGTIKSNAWSKAIKKIDPSLKIYSQSCPLFVPMVEMGFTKGPVTEKVAEEYLKSIKSKNVDVLVLACTHYPLLLPVIKKIMGPKVKVINPAESTAKEIKKFLLENPKIEKSVKKGTGHQFFFSDEPYNLEKISKVCFGKKIRATIKDPF
ncbi:MAG: glutamate racemase [Candidatus Staskawiczbacteria bacterium]|nr:glutamate racemase [Candidatus Staskawiczbacteria bacterium]